MTTRECSPVDVPCNDFPTLNFWEDEEGCLANCTINGVGLTWLKSPKLNLDPRFICIQPPYNPNVSSPTCTGQTGLIKKDGGVIYWVYDAITANCYKIQVDCHWAATNNSFAYNSTCQHMCHDVALPGSGKGHRLSTENDTGNATINGISIFIGQQKFFGFTTPANISSNDTIMCKIIPFFTSKSTTGKNSKCVSSTGYSYDVIAGCIPTSIPCGSSPSLNFWGTIEECQSSCLKNGIRNLF